MRRHSGAFHQVVEQRSASSIPSTRRRHREAAEVEREERELNGDVRTPF